MKKTISLIRRSLRRQTPLEFYIDMGSVIRVYEPGDVVRGKVIVIIDKDQSNVEISAGIRGTVVIRSPYVSSRAASRTDLLDQNRILWPGLVDEGKNLSPNEPVVSNPIENPPDTDFTTSSTTATGPESTIIKPRTQSSSQAQSRYHLQQHSHQHLEQDRQSHQQAQIPLTRARHEFDFEFVLPTNKLVTSLEFERGSVSYSVYAIYSWRIGRISDYVECRRTIQILCPINVARLPMHKPLISYVETRKRKPKEESQLVSSRSREESVEEPDSPATIEVITDVPVRGFVKGESIPIKVTVNHVSPVRSMTGVILTLFRMSQVFVPAGEPETFRKDLSQCVLPLVTVSSNLSTKVTSSLRTPPDIFPTSQSEADQAISFKYYVEVLIDLRGKWSVDLNSSDFAKNSYMDFIDTDKLRRRKGVLCIWLDLVIGTRRSTTESSRSMSTSITSVNVADTMRSSSSDPSVDFQLTRAVDEQTNDSNVTPNNVMVSHSLESQRQEHRRSETRSQGQEPVECTNSAAVRPPLPHQTKEEEAAYEQALMPSSPPGYPVPPDSTNLDSEASCIHYAREAPASSVSCEYADSPPLPHSPHFPNPSHLTGARPLDKLEAEQARMLQQASSPDDHVPSYNEQD